ncbi:MAG: hypothetical protein PHE96_01110 [Methylococcales bacterium]|nr:hypothetical protein [Methylococcales bacterium]
MTESIPNPQDGKQAELQKEAQEKQKLADLEKWELRKQELLNQHKDHWQKQEQNANKRIIDRANGLHLRPDGMKPDPIVDKAGYEKAARDAKAEIAKEQFKWLKVEQEKFFKALKEDRNKQSALEQDKDTEKKQDTGKASPLPSNQPQQDRSRSRYDALRVTEQQTAVKGQQEKAEDRGEHLRRMLEEQKQKKSRDHER